MSDNQLTIRDRLEAILESINLIIEWTDGRKSAHDFMLTPTGVMAFITLKTGSVRTDPPFFKS